MDFISGTLGCYLPIGLTRRRTKLALIKFGQHHQKQQQQQQDKQKQHTQEDLQNPGDSRSECSASIATSHRDSFLVYLERAYKFSLLSSFHIEEAQERKRKVSSKKNRNNNRKKQDQQENDDDTATTSSLLSCDEEEDEDECDTRIVTFSEQLVTAVYTRPRTTKNEKYFLHYTEHDYVDFKVEFMTGRSRNRKVSFSVEDEIHSISHFPSKKERQLLYYSEQELQHFLDEFVQSLNERLRDQ